MHSRFIPDGRPAPVGLVRHACTSSFRTNPIARMEQKAARSRRRNQRRSEYPGRSAIHVCNMTRCDSVCFHSLVPVFDMSDPLKRSAGRLRRRLHSRHVQICKERTMLHSARPRGPTQGRRRGSRTGKKRECFGTETRNMTRPGAARAGIGGGASALPPIDLQSPDGGGAHMTGRVRLALHASRGPSPHHRRSIPGACLTQKTGWISTTARCSTAPAATTAPQRVASRLGLTLRGMTLRIA